MGSLYAAMRLTVAYLGFQKGGNPFRSTPTFPSPPCRPLLPLPSFPPVLPLPSFPLEVGPLNPSMGLGERCKLPSGVWGGAPAEIEFGEF